MRFQLIGVNHKTAPVEVRERLAIPESRLPEACKKLADHPDVAEGMIVLNPEAASSEAQSATAATAAG